jgi:hypothetical protein
VRKFSPIPKSSLRHRRLTLGLRLVDVATQAGTSAARLSWIERHPDAAFPDELDALKAVLGPQRESKP